MKFGWVIAVAILVALIQPAGALAAGPVVTTTTLVNGTVGGAYSQTLAATGGTIPYTWTLTGGTLPAGLTLTAATGVISGTPTATGVASLTFQVTDAVSATATSSAIPLTIQQTTTTTLTPSLGSPSGFGSIFFLTATVAPSTATGKVIFYDGNAILGFKTLSGGTTSLSYPLLNVGPHKLKAVYTGDTVSIPSSSAVRNQTVLSSAQAGFADGLKAVSAAVGANPWSPATGDFNNDGKVDLVVPNYGALPGNIGGGTTVSILLGTGNPTAPFAAQSTVTVATGPINVAVGDFNEDGNQDIAVAGYSSATVTILLGNGSGGFTRSDITSGVGANPTAFAVADFNGDGHADFAVANNGSGNVSVFFGTGTGTFTFSAPIPTGPNPAEVIAADLNGDGFADLLLSNGSGAVSVLLGQSNGVFATVANYPTGGTGTSSLVVGDFNGDGFLDIAAANSTQASIAILLGTGSGTFGTATPFAGGSATSSLKAGDFNGDGKLDLAVSNNSSSNVDVFLGNGNGTFGAGTVYNAATGTNGSLYSVVADLNADGVSDLILTNNGSATVSVLMGLATSTTTLTSSANPSNLNQAITLTATVFPSTATGTITFRNGAEITLGTGTLTNGVATLIIANLPAGTYPLNAVYPGDTTNAASTSGTLSQVVRTAVVVTTSTLAPARVGTLYSVPLTATGGTGTFTWSIATGTMPNGITLAGNGTLSGTPTAPGTYPFTVQATDTASGTGTQTFSLLVNAANSVFNGQQVQVTWLTPDKSTIYAAPLTATVGAGVEFPGYGGANQPPNPAFNINFSDTTIQIDSNTTGGPFGTGVFNGLLITNPGGLPPFSNVTLTAATWATPGAVLFDSSRITFDPTHIYLDFQGMATLAGTGITLQVNGLSLNPPALPGSAVGFPYSTQLSTVGGSGAGRVFSLASGTLPTGLSLNASTGVISGVPTAAGTFTPTIQVVDSASNTASRSYSVVIRANGTINTRWQGIPTSPYSGPGVIGSGGDWWNLFNTGTGSGILLDNASQPTPVGVTWTGDTAWYSNNRNSFCTPSPNAFCQLMNGYLAKNAGVTANVTFNGLPANTSWDMYLYQQIDSGGLRRIQVAINGGTPVSTTTDNSGTDSTFILDKNYLVATGTTDNAGAFSINYHGVGSDPEADINGIQLRPHLAPLTITQSTIPAVAVNSAFSTTLTASGGTGTGKAWTIITGTLPANVTLNSGGVLAGTPATSGTYNFTVQVTDSQGNQAVQALSLLVLAPVTVTTSTLPPGVVGLAYGQTLAASGGTSSYTWSITGGALPAGLSLNSGSGAITGTPTAIASAPITFRATDTNSSFGSATIPLTVNAAVTVNTSALPAGIVGTGYSQTLVATGGNGSYTWSILTGTLPAGLTLTPGTGVISGTPTTAVISNVIFVATDSSTATAQKAITLTVQGASTTTLTSSLASPSQLGRAILLTATITPSAATGKVTFYDGPTPLGTRTLSGGAATLTTGLLGSGSHKLRAYFLGGGIGLPSTSAVVTQTVNSISQTGFGAGIAYASGTSPWGVATADFNKDGTIDVVTANNGGGGGNTVSVYLGTGTGTFGGQTTFSTAQGPIAVATGDFNGDGNVDIAVACQTGNAISILLGNGAGGFAPAVNYTGAVGVNPVSVVVGDFDGDGNADIVSFNNSSATITMILGTGTGTFGAQVLVAAGPYRAGIVAGDFNGDGKTDLAVASFDSNNPTLAANVAILPGLGGGGFGPAVFYPTGGSEAYQIVAADFNGDGKLDLVVPNQGSNSVGLLPGNGDGTFGAAAVFAAGSLPLFAGVGDFNGDGKLDLAVNNSQDSNISVLLGNGAGSFAAATPYALAPGAVGSQHMAVADLNGDGITDLVVNTPGNNAISILLGLGTTTTTLSSSQNPTLTLSTTLTATVTPSTATGIVTFYDGDSSLGTSFITAGVATLSVTNLPVGTRSYTAVYAGDATNATSTSGVLTQIVVLPTVIITTGSPLPQGGVNTPYSVTLGSSGATGTLNWVVTSGALPSGLTLGVSTGLISGTPTAAETKIFTITATDPSTAFVVKTFALTVNPPVSVTTTSLVPATNGVAYSQALTATGGTATGGTGSYTWSIISGALQTGLTLNTSTGVISGTPTVSGVANLVFRATDTVNNVGNSSLIPLTVLQPSSITLSTSATPSQFGSAIALTATLVPSSAKGTVVFYDGTTVLGRSLITAGTSVFNTRLLPTGPHKLRALYTGDALNTPSGASNLAQTVNTSVQDRLNGGTRLASGGTGPWGVATGDFNLDGKTDVVVVNNTGNNVSVFLGTGTGYPGATPTNFAVASSPQYVAVGDFNGDGKPDMAVSNRGSNNVSILLGDGAGGFATAVNYIVGALPMGIIASDFNGDGIIDLAVANNGGNNVGILLGNGNGTFAAGIAYATGTGPAGLIAGDFNGDGYADLAVANQGSNNVSVLLGASNGTFGAAVNYAAGGTGTGAVVAADFNSDGKLDLAVTNTTSNNLGILLGAGDGTFGTVALTVTQAGPSILSVGDFNGDGKVDLAVPQTGYAVWLFGGDGAGNFTILDTVGSTSLGTAVADFNGDGRTDLVFTDNTASAVGIHLGLAPAAISLTTSANPGVAGQNVTLTATVTPSSATGSIQFLEGSPLSESISLVNGVATLALPFTAGTHFVYGVYSGDSTYQGGLSNTLSQQVSQRTTTTSITSSPNPVAAGASVTMTGTVTPNTALGSITFFDGATNIGSGTMTNGVATFSTSGLITGSHSLTGVYNGDTNNLGSTSSAVVQTVYAPLSITTSAGAPVSPGVVGVSYSFTLAASGGQGPYNWTISSGSIPGLTLSTGGVLSGTPQSAGTFPFTARVTDVVDGVATQNLSVTINPVLTISTATVPGGSVGIPYSQQLVAAGGTGLGNVFSITAGAPPTGVTLNPTTGLLSGNPTSAATFSFTAQVTDSSNVSATKSYTTTINAFGLLSVHFQATQQFAYAGPGVIGSPNDNWNLFSNQTGSGTLNESHGQPTGVNISFAGDGVYNSGLRNGFCTASGPYCILMNGYLYKAGGQQGNILFTGLTPGTSWDAYVYTQADSISGRGISVSFNGGTPITTLPGNSSDSTFIAGKNYLTGTATADGTGNLLVRFAGISGDLEADIDGIQLRPHQAPLTITQTTAPLGVQGAAYPGLSLATTGGTGTGQTWSISSGALPAGVQMNSFNGAIGGTPTTAGTYNFTVQVVDSQNNTGTQVFTAVINTPLAITLSSLPNGAGGATYNQALGVTGGYGGYVWSVQSGILPNGLTLNPGTGAISGTPAGPGSSTFTLQVLDSGNLLQSRTITLTIGNTITITTSTLPAAVAGVAYNQTLAAVGGNGALSWTFGVTTTAAAAGFAIDPASGVLSGTPNTFGTLALSVTVQDQASNSVSRTIPLTIARQGGSAYDFAVADSSAGKIFRMSSDGATLITLCGPPTQCHASNISADSQGNMYTHDTSGVYKISPGGTVTTILTRNSGVGGTAVDANGNVIFVDNTTDHVYRVTSAGSTIAVAALPIQSPGELQDTAVTLDSNGNYIVGSDDSGTVKIYRITPAGAATTLATIPGGITGIAVTSAGIIEFTDYRNHRLVAFDPNGSPNNATSITIPLADSVLDGLAIDPGNGHFLVPGRTTGVVNRVTPGGAVTVVKSGSPLAGPNSIAALPPLSVLTITTTSLANGQAGQSYATQLLSASGGSGSYTWSATALAPGLTLSTGGILSGSPTSVGSFPGVFTATDTVSGLTAVKTLTIAVISPIAPVLISGSSSQANVAVGGAVSGTFTASGGVPPYTFSASGLPPGVSLSPGGTLSGTPANAGNSSASISVFDSSGRAASTAFSITVLGIQLPSLPNGTQGTAYSATVLAIGGQGTVSFSAAGLPPGLDISLFGIIAGTPTAGGLFALSVTVTDSSGTKISARGTITIIVPGAPVSIPSGNLPDAIVNTPYSASLTAVGGKSPYAWSVLSGSLPDGLSFSGGSVTGTPTTPGGGSFAVIVTDSTGGTASTSVSINVRPAPLLITSKSPLASGMLGIEYPGTQLAATGGIPPYKWTLSGSSLPNGVTLDPGGSISGTPTVAGDFSASVAVTDAAGTTATGSLGLTIRQVSADLILSAGTASFDLTTGAESVPSRQIVGVQSTAITQQISFSAAASPSVPWLTVTSGSKTPDNIAIAVSGGALSLPAGDYSTNVKVTCTTGSCAGSSQSVAVSLRVTSPPPRLKTLTEILSFATTTQNLAPISQTVTLQNAGGGTLGVATVSCGAPWCSVGAPPSTIAGGSSINIPVTVNPGAVAPGYFRTTVEISTSAGKSSVPVTLFVAQNASMTLSPSGGQFSMPLGGAPGNTAGSFLASVNSGTPVTLSASVLPGADWLKMSTANLSASSVQPGTFSYSIDSGVTSKLSTGAYYGQIIVSGAGISNAPQSHQVVLVVTPATNVARPDPQPAGLLFLTTVGGENPPTQLVTVFTSSGKAVQFQASGTSDGGWLSVSPGLGSTSQPAPATTSVSVNIGGLKQGIYTGLVSYAFAGSAVRSVNVTLVVAPVGGTAATFTTSSVAPSISAPFQPRDACTATSLAAVQTGIVTNFSAPAAWPTPLSLKLVDDCGATVTGAQIVSTFSNGDPPLPLALVDSKNGLYAGTWTPRKQAPTLTISARITAKGYKDLNMQLVGAVTPNSAPLLTPHGTVHAFSPLVGAPLAPGNIVAVYGANLALLTGVPNAVPLPTTVNGTQVLIGGIKAPLYFTSPGQVNAQIPYELEPNKQYQVIVSANGALSTPEAIQLAAVMPGLAAYADGTVIGQHADGTLISAKSPAKAGETAIVYLSGLGVTDNNVASGGAAPGDTLAHPSSMPTLTIGGKDAKIAFVGLTPGLVGLYQMNFEVPAGIDAGNPQMKVTQEGASSAPVLIPYIPK